jgi:hypothetical protein
MKYFIYQSEILIKIDNNPSIPYSEPYFLTDFSHDMNPILFNSKVHIWIGELYETLIDDFRRIGRIRHAKCLVDNAVMLYVTVVDESFTIVFNNATISILKGFCNYLIVETPYNDYIGFKELFKL